MIFLDFIKEQLIGETKHMLEFGTILLSICIITIIIAITISIINEKEYKEFLLNVKAGDIFIYGDSIGSYNRLNDLNKDNPFITPKTKEVVIYPKYTIVIRDVKKNDKGVLWAAYNFIETSDDIENKRKYASYRELENLIKHRIKIN